MTKKVDKSKKIKESATALLEVIREAIRQRKFSVQNLPVEGELDSDEEVISVIDLWNILEGMGTFLTGAEVDEFMEDELAMLQRKREGKDEENRPRDRKSFLFSAFTMKKINAVAPEDDDREDVASFLSTQFCLDTFVSAEWTRKRLLSY